MAVFCQSCHRTSGCPASGAAATDTGCSGACVSWALSVAKDAAYIAFDPFAWIDTRPTGYEEFLKSGVNICPGVLTVMESLSTAVTILDNVNDLGLLVCKHISSNKADSLLVFECLEFLVATRNMGTSRQAKQEWQQLQASLHRLLIRLRASPIIMTIHASASCASIATSPELLVLDCVNMAGDTVSTLHIDPERATLSCVKDMVTRPIRLARDNNAYTFDEFSCYYGTSSGQRLWKEAPSLSSPRLLSPGGQLLNHASDETLVAVLLEL